MSLLTHTLTLVVGVVISYLLEQQQFKSLWHSQVYITRHQYELAIGVLSARGHFNQRQTIRKTWASHFQKSNKTRVWFVLGNEECDIHPDLRLDPYSCTRWKPQLPDDEDNLGVVSFGEDREPYDDLKLIAEICFTVLYPIIIKRLGLLSTIPLGNQPMDVSLLDTTTEEVVVKTSFSAKDPGIERSFMRYQSVEAFLLPKGFEGCVVVNVTDTVKSPHTTVVTNVSELIIVKRSNKVHFNVNKREAELHLVSFIPEIHEKGRLEKIIQSEKHLQEEWRQKQRDIREKLKEEVEKYKDIVLLNVTDVYRNLPTKLLLFHAWLHSHVEAEFVMKTDDDCYVDLQNIMSALQNTNITPHKMWWGSFRNQWLVENHGKWKELHYTADVYPQFACGSGNILSKDLHTWIAQNSHELAMYQGEDVSLGIWMSAVGPTFMQDDRWLCSKDCSSSMFVCPELSTEEISRMWSNRKQCGNPCHCES